MNLRLLETSGEVPVLVTDSEAGKVALLQGLERLQREEPEQFRVAFPTGFPEIRVDPEPHKDDIALEPRPGLPPPRTPGPKYPQFRPILPGAPVEIRLSRKPPNPEKQARAEENRARKAKKRLERSGK